MTGIGGNGHGLLKSNGVLVRYLLLPNRVHHARAYRNRKNIRTVLSTLYESLSVRCPIDCPMFLALKGGVAVFWGCLFLGRDRNGMKPSAPKPSWNVGAQGRNAPCSDL